MYGCYIIGAGNKGALSDAPGSGNEHKYLSYAHAIKEDQRFRLRGFGDIIPEKKRNADMIWKPEAIGTEDIIIIASSDDAHYEYLKEFVKWGYKLVICEKPLCLTVDETREIVKLYKENNVPLLVDYTRRFIPEFRAIKSRIANGEFGKFLNGFLYFNRGWEHTASHWIDMALWYNGSMENIEIREVKPDYQWVFQWGLFYENNFVAECYGKKEDGFKVSPIFDNHIKYVMDNAYNFLEGKEELLCTGEDALKALEETIRFKEGK